MKLIRIKLLDTDDQEYLTYNTSDDEDNRDSSDLSSIPASNTDSERDEDYIDDDDVDDKEEGKRAAKLYRQTLDQIFANPDLEVVEYELANSGDDAEDEDYCDETSNIVVVGYSLRFSASYHILACLLYFRIALFAIHIC